MERPSGQEPINTAIKGFAIAIVAIVIVAYAVSSLRESTIETRAGTTYPYENSRENAGTAYLTIDAYDEITSGTLTGTLTVSDNVYLKITLNGTTILDNIKTENKTVDNTVTSYIVDGLDNWVVTIDNASRLTAPFTTTLSVTTYEKSVGEEIATGSGNATVKIFTLLFLTVVIGVVLYLLRRFEAI